MSGAREIRTPSRQGITPVGNPRPSRKTVERVVPAVAVPVFEDLDRAAGRPLAVEAERIVPHLDHPEPAVRPPVEGDRVADQRLGGHQLDPEPRRRPGSIRSAASGDLGRLADLGVGRRGLLGGSIERDPGRRPAPLPAIAGPRRHQQGREDDRRIGIGSPRRVVAVAVGSSRAWAEGLGPGKLRSRVGPPRPGSQGGIPRTSRRRRLAGRHIGRDFFEDCI